MAGKPTAAAYKSVLAMGLQELDMDSLTVANLTVTNNFNATTAVWEHVPADNVTIEFLASGKVLRVKPGGINTSSLADNAVTTAKIADGSVTDAKVVTVAWSKITGAPSPFSLPDPLTLNWGLNFNNRATGTIVDGLALQRYLDPNDNLSKLMLSANPADAIVIRLPQVTASERDVFTLIRRNPNFSNFAPILRFHQGGATERFVFSKDAQWSGITASLNNATTRVSDRGVYLSQDFNRGLSIYMNNFAYPPASYADVFIQGDSGTGGAVGTHLNIKSNDGNLMFRTNNSNLAAFGIPQGANDVTYYRSIWFDDSNNADINNIRRLIPRDNVGTGLRAGWLCADRTAYCAWRLPGGTSHGYLWGNHDAHGDAVMLSYNYTVVKRVTGGPDFTEYTSSVRRTSQVEVGDGRVEIKTTNFNAQPPAIIVGFGLVAGMMTYYPVTNGGGTTLVLSGNTVRPASSSLRYKENVRDLSLEIPSNIIYKLRPKAFNYIADRGGFEPNRINPPVWTKEELAQLGMEARFVGQLKPGDPAMVDTYNVSFGLIAEEVAEVGGDKLCFYDQEKRIDSVQYNEVGILVLAEVQRHEVLIQTLTDTVAELMSELIALRAELRR